MSSEVGQDPVLESVGDFLGTDSPFGSHSFDEEVLEGGNVNVVTKVGLTVRRETGPWTPAVHALLAWVRARGFSLVPVPCGVDGSGREVLSYIEGQVGDVVKPHVRWSADVLNDAGKALRQWHDAARGFDLPGAHWQQPVRQPVETICLNDAAPYNMVFRDSRLVGLIDIDMASPGPRIWDIAYLAYRMCPFVEDADAPAEIDPQERLTALLGAYGAEYSTQEVLTVMAERVGALAEWTESFSLETGRSDLVEHAAMYRRDVQRLVDLAS